MNRPRQKVFHLPWTGEYCCPDGADPERQQFGGSARQRRAANQHIQVMLG
jgi:hypothetical protein